MSRTKPKLIDLSKVTDKEWSDAIRANPIVIELLSEYIKANRKGKKCFYAAKEGQS